MFAGAFDEDWERHLRTYELLCSKYDRRDEDRLEFRRPPLRVGALDFYHDSNRQGYFIPRRHTRL